MMRLRYPLVAVAVFLLIPLLSGGSASAQVVITDIAPPGSTTSLAEAVNDSGDIVGTAQFPTAPNSRAIVWRNQIPSVLNLGCPSCPSVAMDINNAGDIVGGIDGPVIGNAFLWRNGSTTLLPPLPGDTRATANSVNEFGVAVGVSSGGGSGSRAVRWVGGVPEWLGTLGGAGSSDRATAINDLGTIVGNATDASGLTRPFVWQSGVMSALPLLPNATCFSVNVARGINNAGVIVGGSSTGEPGCLGKPVKWVNGVLETLPGVTPGNPYGTTFDISESGDIVGWSAASLTMATLWRNGVPMPLGQLPGGNQSIAADINAFGLIAGRSNVTTSASSFHANSFFVPPSNTPPSLSLPSDIVVNAESAAGAQVFFIVTADDAEDGTFNATCNPSNGAYFAIGTTTVTCEATDTGGLDATGFFNVTVLGAQEQAEEMLQQLGAGGPGGSLQNKLNEILESLGGSTQLLSASARTTASSKSSSTGNICAKLQAFIHEVSAQAGKKLTEAQAASLLAAAQRIRTVIGC
jgi:probable HAF family extracellular repeat protein